MIATKKFLFPVFALSFVLLFLIMSCNEPNISENAADENLGNALMKDSLTAFHTDDKKTPCRTKDAVVWNIDHYLPINRRKIRIYSKFVICTQKIRSKIL